MTAKVFAAIAARSKVAARILICCAVDCPLALLSRVSCNALASQYRPDLIAQVEVSEAHLTDKANRGDEEMTYAF